MWKVYVNKNFDPNKPNGEPPFLVCKGDSDDCHPAFSEDEAYELCKKLNDDPEENPGPVPGQS